MYVEFLLLETEPIRSMWCLLLETSLSSSRRCTRPSALASLEVYRTLLFLLRFTRPSEFGFVLSPAAPTPRGIEKRIWVRRPDLWIGHMGTRRGIRSS